MSRYLESLPAIFQQEPFLGRFLLAFERVLTGRMGSPAGLEGVSPGLEETLDRIHTFFDPGAGNGSGTRRAPDEFLPWLAGWVATSLRDDWSSEKRRSFIQQATTLYKLRGTPSGLAQMVSLFTDCPVQVIELDEKNGGAPHYFKVVVSVYSEDISLEKLEDNARFIIEQEKPAHTWYGLLIQVPAHEFQIVSEVDSATQGLVIGHTTVLGPALERLITEGEGESDDGTSTSVAGMRIRNRTDAFNPGLRVGKTTRVQGEK